MWTTWSMHVYTVYVLCPSRAAGRPAIRSFIIYFLRSCPSLRWNWKYFQSNVYLILMVKYFNTNVYHRPIEFKCGKGQQQQKRISAYWIWEMSSVGDITTCRQEIYINNYMWHATNANANANQQNDFSIVCAAVCCIRRKLITARSMATLGWPILLRHARIWVTGICIKS